MMIPYTRYKASDGHLVRLPLVSIRLATNRKHETIWALIDSGADCCVFSAEIADLLDIDLTTGRELPLSGFVGGDSPAWLHQINLTLAGYPGININAAFTNSDKPELSILGQAGFFDNFQIRFQRYKDLIEIYPKSTSI